MNASKAKGTAAETAVARFARANGFAGAERRALAGSLDRGDVLLTVGVICEVKAGRAAQTASLGQVGRWLGETTREMANAKATVGILVVQRQGLGLRRVGEWEAWMVGDVVVEVLGADDFMGITTMVGLADALLLLRRNGHGDEP